MTTLTYVLMDNFCSFIWRIVELKPYGFREIELSKYLKVNANSISCDLKCAIFITEHLNLFVYQKSFISTFNTCFFRLHNNYWELSICTYKFERLFCTENAVFDVQIHIIIRFGSKR